jgi:hypothetical protein
MQLHNALARPTIEGAGNESDVQLLFSTYGLPQQTISQIENEWLSQLKRVLS